MPVDAGIYGQIRQPQQRNMLADYAQALQIGDMQQNQEMNRLKADEYRRGVQRQDALTNLYSSTPQNELENKLLTSGYAKESFELGKQRRENLKTDAETANKTVDTQIKIIERTASALSQATDQNSYNVVRQSLISQFGPQIGSRLPEVFEPAQVQALVAQGLTRAQQLTDERTRQQNAETARHNKASEGIQIRGQNMTDARSREANSAAMSKPFEVTGEDGKPVLVQQDKQGNIRPVQGYTPKQGASSAGTEGERTAAGYADRMSAAEKIITDVASTKPNAQKPGLIEQAAGGVGVVANLSRDQDRQKYRQAQEDWVRAKLRKESGAVIANDEMEREISVYFPQIGDKQEVIKQKAEARKVAEQGMRKAAGRAASPAQPSVKPNIDALLDKYK